MEKKSDSQKKKKKEKKRKEKSNVLFTIINLPKGLF